MHALKVRFSASGFGNIPNGEVNRICSFIAGKLGKLRFVSCDNDWSQSSARGKMRLSRY